MAQSLQISYSNCQNKLEDNMVSLAYIYYKGINSMAAYSSTVHQLSGSRLFRGEEMSAERVWKILGHAPKLLATPLDRHSLIQYASLKRASSQSLGKDTR